MALFKLTCNVPLQLRQLRLANRHFVCNKFWKKKWLPSDLSRAYNLVHKEAGLSFDYHLNSESFLLTNEKHDCFYHLHQSFQELFQRLFSNIYSKLSLKKSGENDIDILRDRACLITSKLYTQSMVLLNSVPRKQILPNNCTANVFLFSDTKTSFLHNTHFLNNFGKYDNLLNYYLTYYC